VHIIRSSDIGAYLYCRRAWWYRKQGLESANQSELAAGTELHARHGRQVLASTLNADGWIDSVDGCIGVVGILCRANSLILQSSVPNYQLLNYHSPMLYLSLALLFLALLFFWQSGRQRKAAGLPGGRIIYTDTRGWGKLEKPLFHQAFGLTGKPDYLIQQNGQIIPVEVKSGRAPEAPYDSHIYQLASYCLLVEKTYNKRPPYGIIHYEGRVILRWITHGNWNCHCWI
jgi:CRISPR/Cas system-associated exonuclease Cas4 (RecB family)